MHQPIVSLVTLLSIEIPHKCGDDHYTNDSIESENVHKSSELVYLFAERLILL